MAAQHTRDVRDSGFVFTWGGHSSVLGHKMSNKEGICALPEHVPGLSSIVFVAAGERVSGAVTNDGQLFTWGNGARCGHGDESGECSSPKLVQFPASDIFVVSVSFGESHAACLDRNGRVFVWGKALSGCLGNGSKATITTPRCLLSLVNIVQVRALFLYDP